MVKIVFLTRLRLSVAVNSHLNISRAILLIVKRCGVISSPCGLMTFLPSGGTRIEAWIEECNQTDTFLGTFSSHIFKMTE